MKSIYLATAFTFLAAALPSHAALVITEVMSSSAHTGGTNNADWFELTNNGTSAFDLTGWTWNDFDTSDTNAGFGLITSIAAGQSIIITGEPTSPAGAWAANWGISPTLVADIGSEFHNFSSSGDTIYIYGPTDLVNPVLTLTFGAATSGFSFEWDTAGNSLGLSVAGENGAAAALSNGQSVGLGAGVDVGSPGLAIPEPSSALLLGVAGLGAFIRRRK